MMSTDPHRIIDHRTMLLTMAMTIVAAGSQLASAQIVNGSFETGDLTAWRVFLNGPGYVQVANEFQSGIPPVDGLFVAKIVNYAYDWDTHFFRQTFNAGVGDVLSFDYYSSGWGRYDIYFGLASLQQPVVAGGFSTPPWTHFQTTVQTAGSHRLTFAATKFGDDIMDVKVFTVDNVRLTSLTTAETPLLPTTVVPGDAGAPPRFIFDDVPSGQWFDPPMAEGFTYQMTAGSLFTGILDFPTGFNQPFNVAVGDTVLGQFGPGQSVDFTSFPGGGVSGFQITGLDPGADPNSPTAFPLRLVFNTNTADFTMQAIVAVPEPGSLVLATSAFAIVAAARRRKHRKAPSG